MTAFARLKLGPVVLPGGLDTNKGDLLFDYKNGVIELVPDSGIAQALQTSLATLAAQTAITAITTAQNLINKTLGIGVLNKLGRTLLISGYGIYTSAGTTAPALTIALKLGAVTLCTITLPAMSTTARTNAPFQFQFVLSVAAQGSTGTIESHGAVIADLNAAAAGAVSEILDSNVAVSSAVDLTSALALTVTLASNLALTSAQLRSAQIEVLF